MSVVKAKTNSDRHTALAILRASDLTSVQNDEYMGSITGPVEAIRLNVSDLTGTSPTVTLDVRSRPIR